MCGGRLIILHSEAQTSKWKNRKQKTLLIGGVANHYTASLTCLSSPQLVVSLLLVTAIAALAVTLGEDYGPNKDSSSTVKNAGVFYVNPVLYAVTWVNITGFFENIFIDLHFFI